MREIAKLLMILLPIALRDDSENEQTVITNIDFAY